MNTQQLGYKLAPLFIFLVFLFIASRLSHSNVSRFVRNVGIVFSSFMMIIGLWSFLGIEHSGFSLGLVAIISALFIGPNKKKNV